MRWRPPLIMTVIGLLAVGIIELASGAQSGAPSPPVARADIAALSEPISAFARDLERLRRFMGARKVDELDIGIRSAIPRDLYFQALTLWEKTDRLTFEVSRTRAKPPPPPAGDIGPREVLISLQDAHQHLRQAMERLQIANAGEPTAGAEVAPADLFNAIVNLNRQLNLLLERHISPSDVYKEVTLAIGYSARLLAPYPDATRIPEEPPFEPDKQPRDVYWRLIECLQNIVRIFEQWQLPILAIDTRRTDLDRLQPGDVYLIAVLIVSQLDFLHKRLNIIQPPPQPIYPGLKFPAHSYQRAGILQVQLRQLERYLAPAPATKLFPESP